MNKAQKKFASERDNYESMSYAYDGWSRAELLAREIQCSFPNMKMIDIMSTDWKNWLCRKLTLIKKSEHNIPNNNYKERDAIAKSYLCDMLLGEYLDFALSLLNLDDSHDDLLIPTRLTHLIEAAAHSKALEYEFYEEHFTRIDEEIDKVENDDSLSETEKRTKSIDLRIKINDDIPVKNLNNKIRAQFNITNIELKCGKLFLETVKYMDFLFRHNAHTGKGTATITINPSVLPTLAVRLSEINDLYKELSATSKQELSREPSRQAKEHAKSLWIAGGKTRTFDEANRLKDELEKINIKRSSKTIYDWMSDW